MNVANPDKPTIHRLHKTTRAKDRPTRKPIGYGDVLKVAQREGYHRALFLEGEPERIEEAKKAGYEFVTESTYRPQDAIMADPKIKDHSNQGSSIIKKNLGGGEIGILMEIPLQYKEEMKEYREYERAEKLGRLAHSNVDPHARRGQVTNQLVEMTNDEDNRD
jgi:hypothetical protein